MDDQDKNAEVQLNFLQVEEEVRIIENHIKSLDETNDRLIERYGSGGRPAWVGEEIGINMAHIQNHRARIEELKNGKQ